MIHTTPPAPPLPELTTVAEVIDALGRDWLAKAFAVTRKRIDMCRRDGVMPASWFDATEAMARAAGYSVSRDMFAWKKPTDDE